MQWKMVKTQELLLFSKNNANNKNKFQKLQIFNYHIEIVGENTVGTLILNEVFWEIRNVSVRNQAEVSSM